MPLATASPGFLAKTAALLACVWLLRSQPLPVEQLLADGELILERGHNRTLYLQPEGGLGNRLRTLAYWTTITAQLANTELGFDLKLVKWTEQHGKWDWQNLFAAPTFRMLQSTEQPSDCEGLLHWHHTQLGNLLAKFHVVSTGQSVLCVTSFANYLPANDTQWFYDSLVPSPAVQRIVQDIKQDNSWHTSSWIGVHMRAGSDLAEAHYRPHILTEFLPAVQAIVQLHSVNLRIYLASDDLHVRQQFSEQFPAGMVVTYPEESSEGTSLWNSRETVAQNQRALAEALLLASCPIVFGTAGSSYSADLVHYLRAPAKLYISVGKLYNQYAEEEELNRV